MRIALLLLTAAATLAAQEPVLDLRDWPIALTTEAQLFVDGHLIAKSSGVAHKLHHPERHPANPLLTRAEGERIILAYGSVFRDPGAGRYRMWYTNSTGIAYAESEDGIRFTRPPVGLTIDGKRTNTLTRGHRGRSDTLTILENPDRSDPRKKYLAYAFEYRYPDKDGVREQRREGLYLSTSPNGIHWTERPDPVMYSEWRNAADQMPGSTAHLGDVHHISWDPKLGKFIGHIKITVGGGVRTRGMAESADGIHWSDPRQIMYADAGDRRGDQIYSMIAFPYESVWLAFVGLFHKETDDRLDIQLAVSRDGRHWTRPYREPFFPNGPEGSFDWGVLHMIANPPLLVDGKLRLYYGGIGSAHGVRIPEVKKMGIGLATLRPDGFVSLDAGAAPGEVTTRPLRLAGDRLWLNAAVAPGGEIRVALLKQDYSVAAEDSLPVAGDSMRHEVRFNPAGALAAARQAHPYLRLRFRLKNASLYSFRAE